MPGAFESLATGSLQTCHCHPHYEHKQKEGRETPKLSKIIQINGGAQDKHKCVWFQNRVSCLHWNLTWDQSFNSSEGKTVNTLAPV